ncbi:TPA: Fe-S cluster assembly protein NifU [Klebsiella quasipneumoniae subsp. quasipneumoniae]|jgi:NifU-like protein|uniref:Nitrogen fixation protein NifU n=1 Tax=Klebsiella quasipneumoniae subsp. quasipneumoniae TaxID=1667327 RepID=A0AAW8XKW6_9ENTR|nr:MULTISPECIES: Fe-S cluster assembly protein NifU [Klebsiella]EIY5140470.1 Fe-S cluster assembly protein NifU [Klebsiella variicola]HDZ9750838.1 Fe-S cluster assembly protein NifU [Klebsiella quasipneumoniae subsp. similipneumoniae]HEP1040475.1 Fe-S cluster assembly protein NifU [Klebsiella pneumoniae subsp. pneumoniae]AWX86810.1 Fe-S cluster assembly protein NifU [Klebsiella quasipneumoniae subsp. quasipneumoniae]EIY4976294.1 Fe-S cluster assembly protein NifU [Klebsiella quasipneumoniae]
MWNYSEKVKDHFFHPRNARVVDNANAVGDVGSLSCGDALRLMLRVDPHTEIIEEAGFQTFGCGSAIASSSALTELIIGHTLTEAGQITNQQIADYLDGLPPEKMHCSVMGQEALRAAIAHFRGESLEEEHEEGKLICKCFGVDEGHIRRAVVNNGLTTLEEVINYTKAGGGCTACHEKIELALAAILAQQPPAPLPAETAHDAQWQSVVDTINELRPHIQADGGDMTLVSVTPRQVTVSLSGSCSGCMMTDMTLAWLQQKLMERTGSYMDVVAAPAAVN